MIRNAHSTNVISPPSPTQFIRPLIEIARVNEWKYLDLMRQVFKMNLGID